MLNNVLVLIQLWRMSLIRESKFFVDEPGGTSKTFSYRALLAKVRSMGLIVVTTVTSGIAASIMPGGRTPTQGSRSLLNLVIILSATFRNRVVRQIFCGQRRYSFGTKWP
jgi:hypothetical protein